MQIIKLSSNNSPTLQNKISVKNATSCIFATYKKPKIMKFILILLFLPLLASSQTPNPPLTPENTVTAPNKRVVVSFLGKQIELGAEDFICATPPPLPNKELGNWLAKQLAIEESQLLDVRFEMPDEELENGLFTFQLETEDARTLTLLLWNQESKELVQMCAFEVTEGQNYKALDISALDNGVYLFRLLDGNKLLNRTLRVKND